MTQDPKPHIQPWPELEYSPKWGHQVGYREPTGYFREVAKCKTAEDALTLVLTFNMSRQSPSPATPSAEDGQHDCYAVPGGKYRCRKGCKACANAAKPSPAHGGHLQDAYHAMQEAKQPAVDLSSLDNLKGE